MARPVGQIMEFPKSHGSVLVGSGRVGSGRVGSDLGLEVLKIPQVGSYRVEPRCPQFVDRVSSRLQETLTVRIGWRNNVFKMSRKWSGCDPQYTGYITGRATLTGDCFLLTRRRDTRIRPAGSRLLKLPDSCPRESLVPTPLWCHLQRPKRRQPIHLRLHLSIILQHGHISSRGTEFRLSCS